MLSGVREKLVAGAPPRLPNMSGPGDGIGDTGVNMLGRSRISHAARAEEVRGCRGYSLSHASRINRKWLSEQRPKSVNKVFLAISGRTVCHSTCRRHHDCH
jgi:hypothetical protein